jgi:hypothetical protein
MHVHSPIGLQNCPQPAAIAARGAIRLNALAAVRIARDRNRIFRCEFTVIFSGSIKIDFSVISIGLIQCLSSALLIRQSKFNSSVAHSHAPTPFMRRRTSTTYRTSIRLRGHRFAGSSKLTRWPKSSILRLLADHICQASVVLVCLTPNTKPIQGLGVQRQSAALVLLCHGLCADS